MEGAKPGFEVPVRTADITFEGTDYDGAIIECLLDVPLAWYFDVQRAQTSEDLDENERFTLLWAERCLKSWNLTSDGVPIECTAKNFMGQPTAFTTAIIAAWQREAASPPAPLSVASNDGDSSAEESTRTDA